MSVETRILARKFPPRLAKVRGKRSQTAFADDLGVFQQNVSRYQNGGTPSVGFLLRLAKKENVSLNWLLLGKGAMRLKK